MMDGSILIKILNIYYNPFLPSFPSIHLLCCCCFHVVPAEVVSLGARLSGSGEVLLEARAVAVVGDLDAPLVGEVVVDVLLAHLGDSAFEGAGHFQKVLKIGEDARCG